MDPIRGTTPARRRGRNGRAPASLVCEEYRGQPFEDDFMKRLIQAFIWWFTRTLVHCRYRVVVEGLDKIRDLRGPVLVMPNHPGYIDPVLILSRHPVRPIVAAGGGGTELSAAVSYPIMRLIDALEVPELTGFSQQAQQRTVAVIDAVVAGLARGECFVIYPSGRARAWRHRGHWSVPLWWRRSLHGRRKPRWSWSVPGGCGEARLPTPGRVSRPSWAVAWRGDSAGLWPGCFSSCPSAP